MKAALGMAQGSLQLGELRCDRGGEFTYTWGSTKTAFDEAIKEIFRGRWLGSPDAPKTAPPHIERFCGAMGDAAGANECAAGTAPGSGPYSLTHVGQRFRLREGFLRHVGPAGWA